MDTVCGVTQKSLLLSTFDYLCLLYSGKSDGSRRSFSRLRLDRGRAAIKNVIREMSI